MNVYAIEERITAYHEAGHTVLGCLLGYPPQMTSIVPNGKGAYGMTSIDDEPPEFSRYLDRSAKKHDYMRYLVLSECGGTIAADIKFPGRAHDTSDQHDDGRIVDLIELTVIWEDDRAGYASRLRQEAQDMLQKNWNFVELVATALLDSKSLSRQRILVLWPTRLGPV